MKTRSKRLYSWEISDEFWEKVEPYIPKKREEPETNITRPRRRKEANSSEEGVLKAIVYVLRTGIQWKAAPKERFGSASALHRYFLEWQAAGLFEKLWKAGLAEYDEMEGIAWRWQSIDGSMNKAPLAIEEVGPNPTDRGKKRNQAKRSRRRPWNPTVDHRQRSPDSRHEITS